MTLRIARREFLHKSIAMAAGAGAVELAPTRLLNALHAAPSPGAEGEWRNKQSGMRYRRLGRTGLMISEIVCGGDPVSPTNYRHVELAMEMGLNYLDTAPAYGRGESEKAYSAVIQGAKRARVFLTTKLSPLLWARNEAYRKIFEALNRDEQASVLRQASQEVERRGIMAPTYFGNYYNGQVRQAEQSAISNVLEQRYGARLDRRETYTATLFRSVEESLQRLKTDHVDFLLCPHGATSPAEVQIPEIFEAFEKLKQQGKVRFLGVSAHTDPAGVLRAAMETGVYSMAMIAYNFLNRERVEPVIAEAHRRDFGVIAMKVAQAAFEPDRGSEPLPERAALLNQLVPGEMGLHQKAYRFALNNPNLCAVISNMVDEKMVKENLPVAMS